MNSIVVLNIPNGISVRVFKEKEKMDFAKYMLKWKKDLVYAIENIEVPKNLSARGLIQFAQSIPESHKDMITKRNLQ